MPCHGWLLRKCRGVVVNWLVFASQKFWLIGRCFYGARVDWLLLLKCRAVLVGCCFSSVVVALSIAVWCGCCYSRSAVVVLLLLTKCRAMVGWLFLRKCRGVVVNWLVVAL